MRIITYTAQLFMLSYESCIKYLYELVFGYALDYNRYLVNGYNRADLDAPTRLIEHILILECVVKRSRLLRFVSNPMVVRQRDNAFLHNLSIFSNPPLRAQP